MVGWWAMTVFIFIFYVIVMVDYDSLGRSSNKLAK